MKTFYALACALGIALPYWQFLPWLLEHGLDPWRLIADAGATRIGAFAWLDVLVSAVVLLVFIVIEGRRIGLGAGRQALAVVGTLGVGVSSGLPLFLLLRHRHLYR